MIGTLVPGTQLGVIEREQEHVYRRSGAIGSSVISDFIHSEALCQRKHVLGIVQQGRYQPFVVGQALHCLVLESQSYRARYARKPAGFDGRTKAGKDWILEAGDREVLSNEEGATVEAMAGAIYENAEAKELLHAQGQNELTIRLNVERWKLPVQVRLDAWRPRSGMILDLKTTEDLSKFTYSAIDRAYWRQAALYTEIAALGLMIERPRFLLVAVEKREPFRVGLFRFSDEWIERGDASVDGAMLGIRRCLSENKWRRDVDGVALIA